MNLFGYYEPPTNLWDKILSTIICKLFGHVVETVNGFFHCERCGQSTGQNGESLNYWSDEDYE